MSVDADLKAAPQAKEPEPVVEPKAEEQTQADEPLPEVKVDENEPKIESDLTADGDKEVEMPLFRLMMTRASRLCRAFRMMTEIRLMTAQFKSS